MNKPSPKYVSPRSLMENTCRFFEDDVKDLDIEHGEGLYRTYNELLRDLAEHWGFGTAATFVAFAVLSPTNSIDQSCLARRAARRLRS